MQNDPALQVLEDARNRRQILGEMRRVLGKLPATRPSSGIVRTNIANGYRDENGGFVAYGRYDGAEGTGYGVGKMK